MNDLSDIKISWKPQPLNEPLRYTFYLKNMKYKLASFSFKQNVNEDL